MRRDNRGRRRLEHWQIIAVFLGIYDMIAVNLAYFLALWFRFDCMFSAIPVEDYLVPYMKFVPVYSVICLLVFWWMRLYNSIWRFASYAELIRVIGSSIVTAVLHIIGITTLFARMPISYHIFGAGIQFLLVLGIRFSYRFVLLERSKLFRSQGQTRVMLVGAGNAGQMIIRDAAGLRENKMQICCIIDDNPNKWGRYIEGIRVVGGREDILLNVSKFRIEKILVAIPSARAEDLRDILNICKETQCELKILPSMYHSVNSTVTTGDLKDVAVEDLLGRAPVKVNSAQIGTQLHQKVVLVTGGGGSIGSELCRQIAACRPRQLIIFDVYENNAYEIQQELKDAYPYLDLQVLIGSVRDSRRLEDVFAAYRPDIVYHAAAHKHVPLMEASPCEAIKNNVIGTYKTAYAAMRCGCARFVLISTDKAVNPTNMMGASKRLCEMIIQSFDRAVKEGTAHRIPRMYTHQETDAQMDALMQTHTEFVAVRFGNVLGSNGSVIPLFKKQIAKGGPVTVTHPDIIRYFMTIPEAVSLVLQAGSNAKGGEIFVLDMGAPVKIEELARNLIKLSGLKPGEDIEIIYTGLRPGEKLYEEKLMAEEGLEKTANEMIHVGRPLNFDTEIFMAQLKELMDAAYQNDPQINQIVCKMVNTYHPVS